MSRRYLMVGSGPAALKACEAVRALDPGADIVVAGREPEGYYSRPGLAYYLAGEITEKGLFAQGGHALAHTGASYVTGIAEKLDVEGHRLVLQGGETLEYDRLLLATGSRAIIPAIEGAKLRGVVKLDNLEDARDILTFSRQARAAVVVGGGITALEIVEGLLSRKVRVHYFMRKDRYWSNVLDESESRHVEERLRREGVIIHYFTELARIVERDGRVAAVETAAGETIPCEIVGLAIGVSPRKDLAEGAGLECARGVLVDEHLRSSHPDVFAAGDLAETRDPAGGRATLEVLWSSAVEKGWVAGVNMVATAGADLATGAAGGPAGPAAPLAYRKAVALNVTRLAGHRVVIMGRVGSGEDADVKGVVRGDSETWSRLEPNGRSGGPTTVISDSKDGHIRLVLGDDSVVGAVVMGDQTPSFALQALVASQASIGHLRDRLVEAGPGLVPALEQACRDHRKAAHVR